MKMAEFISPRNVYLDVEAGSVKRVLQLMAEEASSATGVAPLTLMDGLLARERLGSTGLGGGVAIPHAQIDGLDKVYGFFMRTQGLVDVIAPDGRLVDVFFAILAPSGKHVDHARLLARISRLLADEIICDRIRKTHSVQEVHSLLVADDLQASA